MTLKELIERYGDCEIKITSIYTDPSKKGFEFRIVSDDDPRTDEEKERWR